MKVLNIDAYADPKRVISYKGVEHAIEEISVQSFIDNLKAAEELEKSGLADKSMSKSFEDAVASIKAAVPTMEEKEIRALKLQAMTAIMQFIRGELDVPAAAEEGAEEKK
jgi:hypothetical protein